MEVYMTSNVTKWNYQRGNLIGGEWYNISFKALQPPRVLTEKDLMLHFSGRPRHTGRESLGCIAASGNYKEKIKWICIDADEQREFDSVMNKLVPCLDSFNISYIIEYSQESRCHFWIPTETIDLELGNQFMSFLL